MAAHSATNNSVKWKPGSFCDFFDRNLWKWIDGEIISAYSDAKGEWVKVRCGDTVHEVVASDPDLRARERDTVTLSVKKMKLIQAAAANTKMDGLLQWALPSTAKQRLNDDR